MTTIGVPREIKQDEYRVAMLPVGVLELTRRGHRVVDETGAGTGSGIPDEAYSENGAEIVPDAATVFGQADLIVKVKEPQPVEWPLMRDGQVVFTYFHFAASEELTRGVLATGATAVAYETLRGRRGDLPLLTPMSEVAGRMSIQEGAKYLERPQEGRGILLGGVPRVMPACIAVLGAESLVKTQLRSLPVSRPMSRSSTLTSTDCVTSRTSCRPTSIRCFPTAIRFRSSCSLLIWSSERCSSKERGLLS